MKHRFLGHITFYSSCLSCGYVDEAPADVTTLVNCKGCGRPPDQFEIWFPDTAYQYVMLLEDYHQRPISQLRKDYFEAVREENAYSYWCAQQEPEFKPTDDWQPITILLYRSLFELLLNHFLWKMVYVQLLPSPDAGHYAGFIVDQLSDVNERLGKGYKFITQSRWNDDIKELGYTGLNQLLRETVKVRNEFVHENPLAGHTDLTLAERAKKSVPQLFELFVKLANKYFHPRAKQLALIDIIYKKDEKN